MTFTVGSDVTPAGISVKRDIIVGVEDWANGFSALQGTQVDITAEDISVTVNGTAVTPVDGTFTFTVSDDTEVSIAKPTAISDIHAGETTAVRDVYNMQGVKVADNADNAAISNLPAGIYIINGKKIVIRK